MQLEVKLGLEPSLGLVTITKMWPCRFQCAVHSHVWDVEQMMSAALVVTVRPSRDQQHFAERTTIQRADK